MRSIGWGSRWPMMEFVCERVEVRVDEETSDPVQILWRGRWYGVKRVVQRWHDWGFPLGRSPRRQGWRVRRHRNYYVLECEGGDRFELYCDRSVRGRRSAAWFLSRKW